MPPIKSIPRAWLGSFQVLIKHRRLLALLIRRDFSIRTSGTVFGSIWMLLQPTLQALAFWFLLDVILSIRFPSHVPFVSYFLTGMLPWLMISSILQRSVGVLSEFSALYNRSTFPVAVLPLVPICVSSITYGTVYLIVAVLLKGFAALIPALMIVLALFIWLIPFSYALAVIGLFIRDTRQLVPFLFTMAMYLTPILYMPAMIPERYQWLLAFNPFADLMAIIHGVLLGMPFSLGHGVRPLVLWLLLMGPTWVLFRRAEPHMREAL